MFPWLRRLFNTLRGRARSDESRGSTGERLAAEWLQREKGFRALVHNWRSPRDRRLEIDLVGDHNGVVVFVEVKTRPSDALVPGYFSATLPRKKRAVLQASRDYILQLRSKPRTIRFDVVEVVTGPGRDDIEIRHYENVPLFPKEFMRRG
jgi:putative endonuclease